MSAAFDPAAFVADLDAAGCRVVLSLPGTRFRPGDEAATYFISWPPQAEVFRSYTAVMAKWADAMDADPDHVARVVAHVSGGAL